MCVSVIVCVERENLEIDRPSEAGGCRTDAGVLQPRALTGGVFY